MKVTIINVFLISLLVASSASAAKLYKWVDANGNISYQDQPPPESGKILSETTVKSGETEATAANKEPAKVVIYTVEGCEGCDNMVTALKKLKIPHIELPLSNDRETQQRILQQTGSVVAPAVFINDNLVQSKTLQELKDALKSAGFNIDQGNS